MGLNPISAIANAITAMVKAVQGWFKAAPARRNRKAMNIAEDVFREIEKLDMEDLTFPAQMAERVKRWQDKANEFFKYNN